MKTSTTLVRRIGQAIGLVIVAAVSGVAQGGGAAPPTTSGPPAAGPPPITAGQGAAAPTAGPQAAPSPLTVGPPIRKISSATAVSTEPMGAATSILQLSDGRVLLNDGTRRRLLLLDTTLKLVSVVLDSVAESANTYGTRPGALFQYRGDSIMFIDQAAYAMLLFDSQLKLARVRAVPRSDELYNWTSNYNGYPGFDTRGRMVYRTYVQPSPPKVAPPPGVPYIPQEADSSLIVAIDLNSRKIDTLGAIRIPKFTMIPKQTPEGYFTFYSAFNPLPSTDEWALMPDGRVAFVRGRDYRIEWRNPDGTMTSSQKIPFDWQQMTEDKKVAMLDSVRKVQTKSYLFSWVASMIRWTNMYAKPWPKNMTVPSDYVLGPGMPKDWILPPGVKFPENYTYACPPGVDPTMPPTVSGSVAAGTAAAPVTSAAMATALASVPGMNAAAVPALPSCLPYPGGVSGGIAPPPPTLRDVFIAPPEDLPDYKPPFATQGVRADGDGNLWVKINPPKPIPGGPVYDIIDPKGELVDRLQIPTGYTLVGFGKGKVVYLSVRDATGLHLARVRLK